MLYFRSQLKDTPNYLITVVITIQEPRNLGKEVLIGRRTVSFVPLFGNEETLANI